MLVCSHTLVEVTECEDVQTLIASTTSRVDGEQNRPGKACSEEGNGSADAKVAEEEVGVKRLVLEGVGIWDLPELTKPVEEASWKCWCSLPACMLAMA